MSKLYHVKDLPLSRNVVHTIEVIGVDKPYFGFRLEDTTYTVKLPKNVSWSKVLIKEGDIFNIVIVDYSANGDYSKLIYVSTKAKE